MAIELEQALIGTGILIGVTGGGLLGYLLPGDINTNIRYCTSAVSGLLGAGLLGGICYKVLYSTDNSSFSSDTNSDVVSRRE